MTIFTATPVLTLFADLTTKEMAGRSLTIRMGRNIIPGILNFHYSENAGAVFGIGQGMQKWLLLGTAVALVAILWAIHRYAREHPVLCFGLGLLLGGALGNAYDRLMLDIVRDFIDVYVGPHHWPTFNVADMAICAGAVIVAIFAIKDPKRAAKTDSHH
jgi:signal peptidase II